LDFNRIRIALGTTLLCCATLATAQWPAKPIRMIVTYAPGGGADLMARLVAPKMQEALGQPIVVENRAGGGGTIGADLVAKSAPDGYTLMLDASSWAVNPSLYPKLSYEPVKGFAPVSLLVVFPNVLVVKYVKTGKVRALAVTRSKRSPSAPDLPTIAEAGVPGYEVYEWNAVFAPAGTPADVIAKTHSALARALAARVVKDANIRLE
jgi:tripartite-type tricarboxylate transporter receptor subunit TctC